MLSFAGGGAVAIVLAWYGFSMAEGLRKRRDFLGAMIDALSFILTEIELGKYRLGYIFSRIDDKKALCGFFTQCNAHLDEEGIRSAWDYAVASVSEKAFLKAEDTEAIVTLSGRLGMSDVSGQARAINGTINRLTSLHRKAEEEYVRLSRPYRSIGILLGAFVMILVA